MNIYLNGTLLGIPMNGRITWRQPLALAVGCEYGEVHVLLPFLALHLGNADTDARLLPRWKRGVWGNRLAARAYRPMHLVGVCLNVNGGWSGWRPYLQATLCLGLGSGTVLLDVGNNSELVPHWAPDLEAT